MPASRLTVRTGPVRIECHRDGVIAAVRHDTRPDISYLDRVGPVELVVDGRFARWTETDITVDSDEIEQTLENGPLRLSLRHTFAAEWTMRLAVRNRSSRPLELSGLRLRIRPAVECVAMAMVAGSEAAYAVLPRDGSGPVLGGRLRGGVLSKITANEVQVAPTVLVPGGHQVMQWRWRWFSTPAAFSHDWQAELPGTDRLEADEVVTLPADPDVAVVAPSPVEVSDEQGTRSVSAAEPGRYRVELRSARGDVVLDLWWAERLSDRLEQWATQALAGPRTSAGVPKLADLSAALVVQRALSHEGTSLGVAAEEALDLFTARLLEVAQPAPLAAVYLLDEYGRTADESLLDEAARIVSVQQEVREGVGLAVMRLSLARLLGGRPLGTELAAVRRLADQCQDQSLGRTRLGRAQLARLEVLAATQPAAGDDGHDVERLVVALGTELGAALPGRPLRPLATTELAYRVVLLRMLPESLEAGALQRWGCTLPTLATRVTAEVLVRSSGMPVDEPAAWLALSTQ